MIIHIDMEATGKRIKKRIEEKGFKKSWMAYEIGVNPAAMYKWFNGSGFPTIENFLTLAVLLDTKIDDLLVWEKVE